MPRSLSVPALAPWSFLVGAVIFGWIIPPASAAPRIDNLSIRALRSGAATTLVITGAELLPQPRIILATPIIRQALKSGATDNRLEIEVTLPAVPPGFYQLRIGTVRGVSNAILIAIDGLPQLPFSSDLARLPVALHGALTDSSTLKSSFVGKKGQRIAVEIEARRLGAEIDPVLEIYDHRHVQLMYAQGQAKLGGDARLETVLPGDGLYTVELHDILYRPGNPGYFRLKIGAFDYADLVFPMGGQRGTKVRFRPIGSAGLSRADAEVDLRGVQGDCPFRLPALLGLSGACPRIFVGELPEVVEVEQAAGKIQEVAAPAVIDGCIAHSNEEDRFRILVKPGTHLRFEVMANRAGSVLDGVLSVRNEAGQTLAEGDDRPDTIDPGLDFTVPAGVHALVVAIRDLEGRGGPEFIYRLSIVPADRPDFGLALLEDRLAIPQGDVGVLRVRANRAGYGGSIKLTIPGLPAGMALAGETIPAGASETLLTFTGAPGLAPTQVLTHIVGENTEGGERLARIALLANPLTQRQPWLQSELVLAITEQAPLRIAWDTPAASLSIGSNSPVGVKVTRGPGIKGAVRLSLVTSQVAPRTPDGRQEDRGRTLRLEGMIPSGQDLATVQIIVPADLPRIPYDVAIKAELLAADGRSVVGTAVTPARRLLAVPPTPKKK